MDSEQRPFSTHFMEERMCEYCSEIFIAHHGLQRYCPEKYGKKDDCKTTTCKVTMSILSILMLFFSIWAIFLALRVQDKETRILHLIFAIALGPIYVICYYSSMFQKE